MCTQCGRCFQPCNHEECKPFRRCIHACANGCLSIAGEEFSSEELKVWAEKEEVKKYDERVTCSKLD